LPAVALRFCGAEGTVCTLAVTVAEWTNEPLVPVTFTVYVPASVVDGTVIVSVDEADPPDETVSEGGLGDALQPFGAVAASVTVPLNPLSDVTFIVEFPEAPALIVRADGDADIEKSGVVIGT
jgi:hypothetical protein